MITIQLQEQQLSYIGSQIMDSKLGSFGNIYAEMKRVTNAQHYAAEEMVPISVNVDDFIAVYDFLGEQKEKYASKPNREMDDLLSGQLLAALQSDLPEAEKADYARLAAMIQARQASFETYRQIATIAGRAKMRA